MTEGSVRKVEFSEEDQKFLEELHHGTPAPRPVQREEADADYLFLSGDEQFGQTLNVLPQNMLTTFGGKMKAGAVLLKNRTVRQKPKGTYGSQGGVAGGSDSAGSDELRGRQKVMDAVSPKRVNWLKKRNGDIAGGEDSFLSVSMDQDFSRSLERPQRQSTSETKDSANGPATPLRREGIDASRMLSNDADERTSQEVRPQQRKNTVTFVPDGNDASFIDSTSALRKGLAPADETTDLLDESKVFSRDRVGATSPPVGGTRTKLRQRMRRRGDQTNSFGVSNVPEFQSSNSFTRRSPNITLEVFPKQRDGSSVEGVERLHEDISENREILDEEGDRWQLRKAAQPTEELKRRGMRILRPKRHGGRLRDNDELRLDVAALDLNELAFMNRDELTEVIEAMYKQLTESEGRCSRLEKEAEEKEEKMKEQLLRLGDDIDRLDKQQQLRYQHINEVLNENFRIVGVVESRLDDFLATHGTGFANRESLLSSVLWGTLDVITNVSVFLLQYFVVKPYGLFVAALRGTSQPKLDLYRD